MWETVCGYTMTVSILSWECGGGPGGPFSGPPSLSQERIHGVTANPPFTRFFFVNLHIRWYAIVIAGHIFSSTVIMPPPRRAPEALCFRVVRPSVRTRISLTRNLKNPLVDFHHTWPRGAPWRVDELIRFWARSQGQRSKVNELGLNMLFLPR